MYWQQIKQGFKRIRCLNWYFIKTGLIKTRKDSSCDWCKCDNKTTNLAWHAWRVWSLRRLAYWGIWGPHTQRCHKRNQGSKCKNLFRDASALPLDHPREPEISGTLRSCALLREGNWWFQHSECDRYESYCLGSGADRLLRRALPC